MSPIVAVPTPFFLKAFQWRCSPLSSQRSLSSSDSEVECFPVVDWIDPFRIFLCGVLLHDCRLNVLREYLFIDLQGVFMQPLPDLSLDVATGMIYLLLLEKDLNSVSQI
jgi:hypothetical protein